MSRPMLEERPAIYHELSKATLKIVLSIDNELERRRRCRKSITDRRVICFIDEKYYDIFTDASEAARVLGISTGSVSNVLSGAHVSVKGYQFAMAKDFIDEYGYMKGGKFD